MLVSSAALAGDPLLAISGAVSLGAVTDEMLLGHWYLVDPRLPRWALRTLAVAALAAVATDGALLLVRGAWPPGGSVVAWAFVIAGLATLVLMAAVLGALRQPSYTGVMAATGLSYLAVITSLAATVLGRTLLPVCRRTFSGSEALLEPAWVGRSSIGQPFRRSVAVARLEPWVRGRPYTRPVKISTGRGDDGTTGLLFGGRVAKDDTGPEAYGTVDEAVSALGVARSLAEGETAEQLLQIQRDLFVAGAELATAPDNRGKLEPGAALVDMK